MLKTCIQVNPFLANLSRECSVSYCDHSPSVVVCLAVRPLSGRLSVVRPSTVFLLTLASTNINQSEPNLVRM